MSHRVIGAGMPWDEACGLVRRLQLDPTSHVASSIAWSQRHLPRVKKRQQQERLWSPEAYVLADLYDLYLTAHTRKGKQIKLYPRPSDPPPRLGSETPLSQAQIRRALSARGH